MVMTKILLPAVTRAIEWLALLFFLLLFFLFLFFLGGEQVQILLKLTYLMIPIDAKWNSKTFLSWDILASEAEFGL